MAKKRAVLSLSVVLSEELYEKARRRADAEDRSMAAIVRRLLSDMPDTDSRVS